MRKYLENPSIRISLVYAAVSASWILLSDRLLEVMVRNPRTITTIQTYKGWLFVALSAWLLGVLLSRELQGRRSAEAVQAWLRSQLLGDDVRTIVFFLDSQGRIRLANEAAARTYGYKRSGLEGRDLRDVDPSADESQALRYLRQGTGGSFTYDALHRRRDGSTFPVSVTCSAGTMGNEPMALCIVQDISLRKREDAARTLLQEIDHRILHQHPLREILQYICEQLVEMGSYSLVLIGLQEPDGTLRVAAAAGDEVGRLQAVESSWTPEEGEPIGLAASFPLKAHQMTLGVLSVYAAGENPLRDESQSLGHLADHVALSILAARDQEQIRLQTAALEVAANAVLIADAAGSILWVNPAWCKMTGHAASEAIGRPYGDFMRSSSHGSHLELLWQRIAGGELWEGELERRRIDGSAYYTYQTLTPIRQPNGETTHVIYIGQDTTERRKYEEHLRFLAMNDPLTGLPNRRAFQEQLGRVVEQAEPVRTAALFLMDLDHFKLLNDVLSQTGGDEFLMEIARLLSNSLHTGEFLSRFGGDEFAILLDSVTPEEARARAERLLQAVGDFRFGRGGRSFAAGASFGVAMIDGTLSASAVLALADAALFAAKEQGKNQAVLYLSDRDKNPALAEENRWAAEIKEALREDRFVLFFQPVVRLDTGRADHFEALIRLRTPSGEILSPGAFLSAAERFRLMPAIDRWVLEQSLDRLRENPDLHIFVNLSGQSLGDEGLMTYVETLLRGNQSLAARLALEITESAAVRDLERVQRWMTQLRQFGCLFALDDFGIGFSSFGYLRALPADYVKIDGSFIRNLDTDLTNRSLVQAINTVAHALGKIVVAEWVENEAIVSVLQELGVEYGQGYRWGKPGPGPRL